MLVLIQDEWKKFWSSKISPWKKLFNRKLCNQEKVVDENPTDEVITLIKKIKKVFYQR